jgi:hypothetical protein
MLLALSHGAYYLPAGSPLRVISLDIGGEELVILLEAQHPSGFDGWVADAATILETLTIV